METSAGFLDNIFAHKHSPELFMNFEPYGRTVNSEHLFTPSPISSWGEKQSASPYCDDRFNRSRSTESIRFDLFETSLNQTRKIRDSRSNGSHFSESSSFFCQPRHFKSTARPVNCPQGQVPFETERYSFAPPSVQFQHQQAFHPPLSCFPLSSQLTDMDIYPPSHALDKEPPLYFPSLEPWTFPPMRLY